MRKLILNLLGFGCLLYTVTSLCSADILVDTEKKKQDSLREMRLSKVAAFCAAYPQVNVRTNALTGVPYILDGDLSKGLTNAEPLDIAYEFFEKNRELFGMVRPRIELKVKNTSKDQYGETVAFKQIHRGIDVYQSAMYAHFAPSGKLKFVNGDFYPDISLSPTPSIDSLSAIETASRDVNFKRTKEDSVWWQAMGLVGKIPSATLAILPLGREYHLVWIVKIEMAIPRESWAHFIDANSGQIVQRLNHRRLDGRVPLQQMVPEKPRRD